jgi:hypothetical protein
MLLPLAYLQYFLRELLEFIVNLKDITYISQYTLEGTILHLRTVLKITDPKF